MTNKAELEKLFNDQGFSDFKWIKTSDIVMAQWTRFKCLYGCPNYGKKATCPPNAPSFEECCRFFSEYQDAVIFHFQKQLADIKDYRSWSQSVRPGLLELERKTFLAGYYKAFLVFFDACNNCIDCVENRQDCRNKKASRPGVDALCVDVYATARKAGYHIEVLKDYTDIMDRYAFLLIE